ncbi:MAG: hypothetical protein ACFB6R_08365 [Alphaproteobacteria bacterium]
MDNAQFRIVPTAGQSALHPALVAIDAVPIHVAHEAADRLEPVGPVKFGHAEGGVVAVALGPKRAVLLDIGLAAAGRDGGIGLHAVHQHFEIARRQAQIEVELADIVEGVRVDLLSGTTGERRDRPSPKKSRVQSLQSPLGL